MESAFDPDGTETVEDTGGDTSGDGPAAALVVELEFSPDENDDSEDAQCETEKLRGSKALAQPNGGEEGAEDRNTGVH